jgi:hypothetical protein
MEASALVSTHARIFGPHTLEVRQDLQRVSPHFQEVKWALEWSAIRMICSGVCRRRFLVMVVIAPPLSVRVR